MCLQSVKFALEQTPEGLVGIGYKALLPPDEHCDHYTGTDFFKKPEEGVWVQAKKPLINSNTNQNYLAGFHLFLSPGDAQSYEPMAKVGIFKFRGVLAFGVQETGEIDDYRDCVIADEVQFLRIKE